MTSPHHSPPGRLLLRLARRLFSESVVTTVVEPAVADLQHDVREAGTATRRLWVRLRGYAALWTLITVVPFSRFPALSRPAGSLLATHDPADGEILVLITALCVPLGIILYATFGAWMFVVLVAGIVTAFGLHLWHGRRRAGLPEGRVAGRQRLDVRFVLIPAGGPTAGVLAAVAAVVLFVGAWSPSLACVLGAAAAGMAVATHDWHHRHPPRVAIESRGTPRHPEINFASIQVMENMAGLLVVVGSVAILVAGLPAFRALLLATILMGVAVAAVLGAWRLHHPSRIAVENSIAPH